MKPLLACPIKPLRLLPTRPRDTLRRAPHLPSIPPSLPAVLRSLLLLAGLLAGPFAGLLAAGCGSSHASLQRRIDRLLDTCDGRVGVAAMLPDGAWITHDDAPLPLMSVFKLPLAVAVLERAQRLGISLASPVEVGAERLVAGTYSPLRDSLPAEGGTVALETLLHYSVSYSDNIACDLLLDAIGGPAALDAFLRQRGCDGFTIRVDEAAMHADPAAQRRNTAPPSTVVRLLDRLLQGELLGAEATARLCRLLEATTTGPDKLRAGVPAEVRLGHKTGSSDRIDGVRIADNDAGYLLFPDGRRCCIAVFVAESRADDAANAALIAAVARTVCDYLAERTGG